jgi:hypothetical protein
MGNAFYKTSPTVSEASWALVAQERKEAYEKLEASRKEAAGILEKVRAELSCSACCCSLQGAGGGAVQA